MKSGCKEAIEVVESGCMEAIEVVESGFREAIEVVESVDKVTKQYNEILPISVSPG